MLKLVSSDTEKKAIKKIRYFDKDALLSLALCLHFTIPRRISSYEDDILASIIDYIEHSTDNRNVDDYELEEDREKSMSDLHLIVKLGEKKQYIKINEELETYDFVDNINESSLFDWCFSDTLGYYLNKIRKEHPEFSFVATGVNKQLLDEPLNNLIINQKQYLD